MPRTCRQRSDVSASRRVLSLDADRGAMEKALEDFSAQGRGRRRGAVLLRRPRHAASGRQLSDAGRRQSAERGRPAPHDQAQRHRVGREARQGAAHHGDRRLPRQSARREAGWRNAGRDGRARAAAPASPSFRAPWRKTATPAPSRSNRGGDIIVYAAEAGRTAADGAGRNSPFSARLRQIRRDRRPGSRLADAARHDQRAAGDARASSGPSCRSRCRSSSISSPVRRSRRRPCCSSFRTPSRTRSARSRRRSRRSCARRRREDREQARREVMVLLSDMAQRSGLKPDQLVTRTAEGVRAPDADAPRDRGIPPADGERAGHRAVHRDRGGGGVVRAAAGPAGGRPGAGAGAGALRRGGAPAAPTRSTAPAASRAALVGAARQYRRDRVPLARSREFLPGGRQRYAGERSAEARRAASRWRAARCSCTARTFFANDCSARVDPHQPERGAAALREGRRRPTTTRGDRSPAPRRSCSPRSPMRRPSSAAACRGSKART